MKTAGRWLAGVAMRDDGEAVGTWSHLKLGTKIELQENEKTPQYQQALQVALLNQKRNDEFVRPARDIGAKIKGIRRKAAASGKDPSAALVELKKDLAELNRMANSALSDVYTAAQPLKRNWVIRRVKARN